MNVNEVLRFGLFLPDFILLFFPLLEDFGRGLVWKIEFLFLCIQFRQVRKEMLVFLSGSSACCIGALGKSVRHLLSEFKFGHYGRCGGLVQPVCSIQFLLVWATETVVQPVCGFHLGFFFLVCHNVYSGKRAFNRFNPDE